MREGEKKCRSMSTNARIVGMSPKFCNAAQRKSRIYSVLSAAATNCTESSQSLAQLLVAQMKLLLVVQQAPVRYHRGNDALIRPLA
jgi:hypothetical protein